MRRQFLIMLGALLALSALLRITPPAKGQFFPPALPGTFGDISTPSVAPPAGATRVYTKNGTVCSQSPLSVETCTGSGGGVTFSAPYVTSGATVFGPSWPLTQPPLTGWTGVNSPTFDTASGYPYMSLPANGGTTHWVGESRSAPTAPGAAIFLLYHDFSGQQTTACGIAANVECSYAWGYYDGTKLSLLDNAVNSNANSNNLVHLATINTTSPTVAQNNVGFSSNDLVFRNPSWLELCDDNTNIGWYFSLDKSHWKKIYQEARTSFLASPSNVFIGGNPNNGTVEVAIISYETRTSIGSCPAS